MQSILTIKNFGPIKDATLDMRDINVFIGPQASGKSTIAKIYTICKSPLVFIKKPKLVLLDYALADDGMTAAEEEVKNFKEALTDFNIRSFLQPDTVIEFSSALHHFSYKDGAVSYEAVLLKKIGEFGRLIEDVDKNKEAIAEALESLRKTFLSFSLFLSTTFKVTIRSKEELDKLIESGQLNRETLTKAWAELVAIEHNLSNTSAKYIPAERNLIPILKGASLSLQLQNVPIPRHILAFGAEVEKAAFELKELDLGFLQQGVKYVSDDGRDMIYYTHEKAIRLTEAASGFQSAVPLLLPIVNKVRQDMFAHHSFVIEEPELNLFPKAQYELVKMLSENQPMPFSNYKEDTGYVHTYTTHSPYILSAFNNMLYANKVYSNIIQSYLPGATVKMDEYNSIHKELFAKLTAIVKAIVDIEEFSAYQIANGTATSIVNRETGLIEDNYLDNVSNEMNDDFEALMELMPKK